MKKLFLIFFIVFLIIVTTITKNSTKKLESQIFSVKESISALKNPKSGIVRLSLFARTHSIYIYLGSKYTVFKIRSVFISVFKHL